MPTVLQMTHYYFSNSTAGESVVQMRNEKLISHNSKRGKENKNLRDS